MVTLRHIRDWIGGCIPRPRVQPEPPRHLLVSSLEERRQEQEADIRRLKREADVLLRRTRGQ